MTDKPDMSDIVAGTVAHNGNLRDRIAAVQSAHQAFDWGCQCGWEYDALVDDSHFDHVADAVIRELPELPVKIVTQDQLDVLPYLTVIREVRPPRRGVDYGGIYERRTSGWQCIAGTWVEPERNGEPMLPVTVLWKGKPDD